MKISIVYESMLGNTHHVAQAIADGMRETHPDAAGGGSSARAGGVDRLLVVGRASSHPRHGVRLQPQAGSQPRGESGGRREAARTTVE